MRAIIRRADPEDAAEIGVMHVRSWQAAYLGLLPQQYLDRLDPADRAERWRRALRDVSWPRSGVLILDSETGILGVAGFGPTRDTDADPVSVGEVAAIYLLPEAWGLGLGRRLMGSVLGHLAAAGYQQATLWVLDATARARRFYEKYGWTEDGAAKREDRHGMPITELRYRKPLPGSDRG